MSHLFHALCYLGIALTHHDLFYAMLAGVHFNEWLGKWERPG